MRFSDASGHKIVSTASADTLGKVDELVVDVGTRRVVAVTVKKSDLGPLLTWDDVTAFGTDAVTVAGPTAIGEVPEGMEALLDKRNRVLKKRVLSTAGQELGSVKDVEFDPATGEVTALLLKKQPDVAGARLVGIGDYAVVVQADPSDRPVQG